MAQDLDTYLMILYAGENDDTNQDTWTSKEYLDWKREYLRVHSDDEDIKAFLQTSGLQDRDISFLSPSELLLVKKEYEQGGNISKLDAINNLVYEKIDGFQQGTISVDVNEAEAFRELVAKSTPPTPFVEKEVEAKKIDGKEAENMSLQELASHIKSGQNVSREDAFAKVEEVLKNKSLSKEDFASFDLILKNAKPALSTDSNWDKYKKAESLLYSAREEQKKVVLPSVAEQNKAKESVVLGIDKKVKDYDDFYALNGKLPSADTMLENVASMEGMGKDIFATLPYAEKEVEANAIEGKEPKNMSLQELASHIKSGQNISREDAFAKVEEVLKNKSLSKEDFASFDLILKNAKPILSADSNWDKYKKAESLLFTSRKGAVSFVNPQMEQVKGLLDNTEIVDGLTLTGKKPLTDTAQNDYKNQFVESVRLSTINRLTTSGSKITPEAFNAEFEAQLVAETLRLAGAQVALEDRDDALKDLANGKKIKISASTMTGYLAAKSQERSTFQTRLATKTGADKNPQAKQVVAKLQNQSVVLDSKTAKKSKKSWAKLMAVGKNLAWTGAYVGCGFLGPVAPAGIAVVATLHTASQTRDLIKKYRKEKDANKELTAKSFCKKNWKTIATIGLTAVSGVTAGMASFAPEVAQSLKGARASAAVSLGIAKGMDSYRVSREAGIGKVKSFFGAFSGAALTTFAAAYANSDAIEGVSGINVKGEVGDLFNTANEGIEKVTNVDIKETVGQFFAGSEARAGAFVDKDHDGIPDTIDRDGGESWANPPEKYEMQANETQINRMLDANPKEVNELIGDGKWRSSAELHKMMEGGQLSDEQLKTLDKLSADHFDEKGKIIDKGLNDYYKSLAEKAAQTQAAAPADAIVEGGTLETVEVVGKGFAPIAPELKTPTISLAQEEFSKRFMEERQAQANHIQEDISKMTDNDSSRAEVRAAAKHLQQEHNLSEENIKNIKAADKIADAHEKADAKLEHKIEKHEAKYHPAQENNTVVGANTPPSEQLSQSSTPVENTGKPEILDNKEVTENGKSDPQNLINKLRGTEKASSTSPVRATSLSHNKGLERA